MNAMKVTKISPIAATDLDETPSASSQPLPAVPSPSFETNKKEEDGVCEGFPWDK